MTAALVHGEQAGAHAPVAESVRIELGTLPPPGTRVTYQDGLLTIMAGGSYVLSGGLTGQVVVDAPGALVTLVLDGARVHNPSGPALLVTAANGVTVELAAGSLNRLSDGGTSELDAALYSEAPLTVRGTGELDVEAVYEGIASTTHIAIAGGTVRVRAGEDGLNANRDGVSRISVTGGHQHVQSETGDGIDSNGSLEISGGTVVALGSFEMGEGGLDADGGITITGGTVVATGARGPIPLRTPGAQKALVLDLRPVPRVGELLALTAQEGEVLLAVWASQRYAQLVFSSPEVLAGSAYGVHRGGEPRRRGLVCRFDGVLDLGALVATVEVPDHPRPTFVPR